MPAGCDSGAGTHWSETEQLFFLRNAPAMEGAAVSSILLLSPQPTQGPQPLPRELFHDNSFHTICKPAVASHFADNIFAGVRGLVVSVLGAATSPLWYGIEWWTIGLVLAGLRMLR